MASKKRIAIITILLLWYLYLLNFSHCLSEDVMGGSYQVIFILFTLKLIYAHVEKHVYLYLYNLFQTCFISGWLRVLSCFTVISVLAYLSVTVVLDQSFNMAHDYSKEFLSRLEGNIVELHEDRTEFETFTVHPITKGMTDPMYFQQVFRYPMEDAKIKCSGLYLKWFSSGRRLPDAIIWRKDGVDLRLSERHRHNVKFKEVLDTDTTLKEKGLSWYEAKSTLTISLLQDEDFGSYTCHVDKRVDMIVRKYLDYLDSLEMPKNFDTKGRGESPPTPRSDRNHKCRPVPNPLPHCTQLPAKKPQFQDSYAWLAEIRLTRMNDRKQIISVPPGAILSFKTSYWHLSKNEEIEVYYTVNGRNFHQLCGGFLNGCSKFLFLYWKITHHLGYFGIPPLQLFTIWESPFFPAKQDHYVHCLCEKAYGYHKVEYFRHYFNLKKQKYEVVEITHPHQLIVIPRNQDMLDVYTNTSSSGPVFRQPSVPLETSCSNTFAEELESIAWALVELFRWKEWNYLLAVIFVSCCYIWLIFFALCKLARYAKHYILEGGLSTLTNPRGAVENAREFEYDVFLSYSDADEVLVTEMIASFLETHRFRVFQRGRNVAEGMQELFATGAAMERAERFLIIATGNYFTDEYSGGFEAGVLLECIYSPGHDPRQLLVVKLDQCEIPQCLSHFTVHDWTLGLPLRLHQRKLLMAGSTGLQTGLWDLGHSC